MSGPIHFQPESLHTAFHPKLADAARRTLSTLERVNCELTVVFAEVEEIRNLNLEFAGNDFSTDVLSFPDGSEDPISGVVYLGDVILCIPIAEANADLSGHLLEEELILLTIHGVLHLLGFNHQQPEDKRQMWKLQSQILKDLNLDLKIP